MTGCALRVERRGQCFPSKAKGPREARLEWELGYPEYTASNIKASNGQPRGETTDLGSFSFLFFFLSFFFSSFVFYNLLFLSFKPSRLNEILFLFSLSPLLLLVSFSYVLSLSLSHAHTLFIFSVQENFTIERYVVENIVTLREIGFRLPPIRSTRKLFYGRPMFPWIPTICYVATSFTLVSLIRNGSVRSCSRENFSRGKKNIYI